ncbi:MAG TPA: hypothetical protein VFL60_02250 [Gaiellaceae bacterium]|nr:hypothetical protein [Gaiellaceae bacterium]
MPQPLVRDSPSESILCAALAAAASSLAVYGPARGGDLAAHLWRTSLVQHGFVVWDNLWFAGQYPLASYSLLYYPVAAVTGNRVLGIVGVVAAAGIFSSVLRNEWRSAGRWPGRAFAVLLAGQAFTAAFPYDLGLATMLATLLALQRRRLFVAGACTLLTLGFSPLAFLFLSLALVAVFLWRRRVDRSAVVVGAALAVAAGVQLAALVLLPSAELLYPYGAWRFVTGLALVAVGVALSLRGRAGWRMASLFLVWGAASVAAYAVPSPVGHNLVRASTFLVPLMVVAAALAGFRPRWLALPAVAGALAANVLPYVPMISQRTASADASAAYWRPVVTFLRARLGGDYRVEVVPTANHWESNYLPQAGIPLARGWYRQLDMADDPALYRPHLSAAGYRLWLRSRGVRYVVVPDLPPEAIDGEREARLAATLPRAWSTAHATVYELPRPTPLLTGPAPGRITRFDANEIDGWVARPGTYLLRVHFTPYWSVRSGSVCVAAAAGSMTSVTLRRAGRFELRAIEEPLRVIASGLVGGGPICDPS